MHRSRRRFSSKVGRVGRAAKEVRVEVLLPREATSRVAMVDSRQN